jgi:SAM-dependent methyltransferase
MTWEETIQLIRKDPAYSNLVLESYLDENLRKNIERYSNSVEWKEILSIFKSFNLQKGSLLDIGSGNGITAINFALAGFDVSAVEPDSSITIGAGAIRLLKNEYALDNLKVFENFGEHLPFPNNSFDVVVMRQALHHAHNLADFVAEAARVLKEEGHLFCIREHVVFNKKDKKHFLDSHPLQKFYNGENAFTPAQYYRAFQDAGLKLVKTLNFFDSPINHFPIDISNKNLLLKRQAAILNETLRKKFGWLASFRPVFFLYTLTDKIRFGSVFSEKRYPGRMYSFILKK